MYVYFYSIHVSGSHVPIIRRIIVSMRHIVHVTPEQVNSLKLHKDVILLIIGAWLPETCREQKQTYVKKKPCLNLVIYKDHTRMQGKQNTK